jgi:hypothetical protein
VYEDKKPILPNANDYLLVFNQTAPLPPGTPGSIVRATLPVPATTIPMATITLKTCAILSFHYHPLGSEQIFVGHGERWERWARVRGAACRIGGQARESSRRQPPMRGRSGVRRAALAHAGTARSPRLCSR